MARPALDLKGKRFGRLVARYPVGSHPASRGILWFCECDCGGSTVQRAGDLASVNVQSCGCLKRDQARLNILNTPSHKERA